MLTLYSTVIYLLVFSPLKRRLPCAALFSAGEHKVEYSSIQCHSSKYRYRQRKPSFLPCLPRAPWKRRTMGLSHGTFFVPKKGAARRRSSLSLCHFPPPGESNSKHPIFHMICAQHGRARLQRGGWRNSSGNEH